MKKGVDKAISMFLIAAAFGRIWPLVSLICTQECIAVDEILNNNDQTGEQPEKNKEGAEISTPEMDEDTEKNKIQIDSASLLTSEEKTIDPDKVLPLLSSSLFLFENLDEKSWEPLQPILLKISEIIDLDSDLMEVNEKTRRITELMLLNQAIIKMVFEKEDILQIAKSQRRTLAMEFQNEESAKYEGGISAVLKGESEKFASKCKNKLAIAPYNIIFLDSNFGLNFAPITYNGQILLATEDLEQLGSGAKLKCSEKLISTKIEKLELEFNPGESEYLLNDKKENLPVPVLHFDDRFYICAQGFVEAVGYETLSVQESNILIIYELSSLKSHTKPDRRD